MATESPTIEVTDLNHILACTSADLSNLHSKIIMPEFLSMVKYSRMLCFACIVRTKSLVL